MNVKILNKILAKQIRGHVKRFTHCGRVGSTSASTAQHPQINVTNPINGREDENRTTIRGCRKAPDNVRHPFMVKLSASGMRLEGISAQATSGDKPSGERPTASSREASVREWSGALQGGEVPANRLCRGRASKRTRKSHCSTANNSNNNDLFRKEAEERTRLFPEKTCRWPSGSTSLTIREMQIRTRRRPLRPVGRATVADRCCLGCSAGASCALGTDGWCSRSGSGGGSAENQD